MTRGTWLVAAALWLATPIAGSGAALAHGHEWQDQNLQYHPASQGYCRLRLDRVFSPGGGQPIQVVLSNTTHVPLRYAVEIELRRGRQATSGQLVVDQADPGTQSERPSIRPFPGPLVGSVVTLRVTSCSIRG